MYKQREGGKRAKHIATQKKRIGGNFVMAQGLHSQEIRDHIKTQIPEYIFVTMTLTKENQKKRIELDMAKIVPRFWKCFARCMKFMKGLENLKKTPTMLKLLLT